MKNNINAWLNKINKRSFICLACIITVITTLSIGFTKVAITPDDFCPGINVNAEVLSCQYDCDSCKECNYKNPIVTTITEEETAVTGSTTTVISTTTPVTTTTEEVTTATITSLAPVTDSTENTTATSVTTTTKIKKSNEELANEVWQGLWGNGSDRKRRLTEEGYNYSEVQKIVNKIANETLKPTQITKPASTTETTVNTTVAETTNKVETTTTNTETTKDNLTYVKKFSRGTYFAYDSTNVKGGSGRTLIDCSIGDGTVKGSIASSYLQQTYGYNYNGSRTMVYLEINGYPSMNGYYYLDSSNSATEHDVIDFFYYYNSNCPFQYQGVVSVECYLVTGDTQNVPSIKEEEEFIVFKERTHYIHRSTCHWYQNDKASCFKIDPATDMDAIVCRKCSECNPDVTIVNFYDPKSNVDTNSQVTSGIGDYDRTLLAEIVHHEAGSDWISQYNKAKVAAGVINRVNDSRFPSTVYGVLTQKGQFSGYWPGCTAPTQDDYDAVDYYFSHTSEFNSDNSWWGDGYQNHFYYQ